MYSVTEFVSVILSSMKHISIPHELKKMNELFVANGFEAYLVGGAVRDVLLKKEASDWDVATNATPEEVMRIFHHVIPTGIAHGTVTVLFLKKKVEVTTYRTEAGYSDGRHPDSVQYAASIEDDLSRRDFTMNAIAASLSDGRILDPFGGEKDIKNACIRTVGQALDRFMEDGLRPVRAIRFSAQLGFCIENETARAISLPDVQKKIQGVSIERFRDEFDKMLLSKKPSRALHELEKCGLLAFFIPELASGRGATQQDIRGFHEYDVLDHNVYACDGAPAENLLVRLAALFHDVGKTGTRTVEKRVLETGAAGKTVELIHFHGHEALSATLTRTILSRLKYPNAVIDHVCHLIKEHMFHYESTWTDAAIRRFIVRVGKKNVDDLFALRLADIYGMHQKPLDALSETARLLLELKERIQIENQRGTAVSLKELAVNGDDLLELGFPKGRCIGLVLKELFQCVLDDPAMNTREALLRVAQSRLSVIASNL